MSLPKHPPAEAITRFIDANPREAGEAMEAHLRRLLKQVVLAKVQSNVALRMGTHANKLRQAYDGERVMFSTICRIAEACDCEVILRPRQERPS